MGSGPVWRSRLRQVLTLLVALMLLFALRAWQQRDLVAGPAPPLEGVLLDGGTISLVELRGAPVLVHFWAVWCPVCGLEEEAISTIAGDHQVLTVALRSGGDSEVASYLAEHGLNFPVLNDPAGRHAGRWGVSAVPTSFVIDSRGRIRFREVGYTSGIGLRLRLWLAGD